MGRTRRLSIGPEPGTEETGRQAQLSAAPSACLELLGPEPAEPRGRASSPCPQYAPGPSLPVALLGSGYT